MVSLPYAVAFDENKGFVVICAYVKHKTSHKELMIHSLIYEYAMNVRSAGGFKNSLGILWVMNENDHWDEYDSESSLCVDQIRTWLLNVAGYSIDIAKNKLLNQFALEMWS